jgi:hypothetical protein
MTDLEQKLLRYSLDRYVQPCGANTYRVCYCMTEEMFTVFYNSFAHFIEITTQDGHKLEIWGTSMKLSYNNKSYTDPKYFTKYKDIIEYVEFLIDHYYIR